MTSLVEAEHVSRHYALGRGRTLKALDMVSLGIARGETVGLVGESGSGKSTLGRVLAGLQKPTSGKVYFDGEDTAGKSASGSKTLRLQRQIVFQDPSSALNPRMTLTDSIVEHLRVQGWSRAAASDQAAGSLLRCGLHTSLFPRYPHEISGGQRQRAVIARAISANPAFIVADEPVSALDVSTRAQIMNLLRDIQSANGLTMLFISHDLGVVAHMCRTVAVMYLGRIVEIAPRHALYHAPKHPYTSALIAAIPVPDPIKARTRGSARLSGEMPDPIAVRTGCRFVDRCRYATDLCKRAEPDLREVAKDHVVACHHPLTEAEFEVPALAGPASGGDRYVT